jgi:rhamnosyl/mannosyltransferase
LSLRPDGLRVLTVSSESASVTSGLGATVGRIADGLRERGHRVDEMCSGDAAHLRVGEFRLSGLAAAFPEVETLRRAFDVIHVHGPCPTVSDALLARLTRGRRGPAPVIVYTHHFDVHLEGLSMASRLYNRGHLAAARRADHVVATTAGYAGELARSMGRPVDVIPWGVDTHRFRPNVRTDDGPLRILFVGQMRHYKGVSVLIDAVDGMKRLELTVAGGGPREVEYRQRAKRMSNVTVLGRVSDDQLVELYRDHDVIVLPSVSPLEAFGLVLLEGMASGCVPVASDLLGVRDIAGPTGAVVRPGDVASLRAELLQLALYPAQRVELALRSVAQAGRSTWDATVDAYETLMVDAVRRRHPQPTLAAVAALDAR